MGENMNSCDKVMKELELFHYIKKEVIPVGGRYYLFGICIMTKFFSRSSVEKLVEKEILKRLGFFRKQPKEIRQMFSNNHHRFNYLTNSRSKATILWEVDFGRLISLIEEKEIILGQGNQ